MSIFDEIDMTTGNNYIPVVEEKPVKVSLFEILKSIYTIKDFSIDDEETEKAYNVFMINRGLSMGVDTIGIADYMNTIAMHNLDKDQHLTFLNGVIRKRKRYNKWIKAEVNKDVEVIKFYKNCSDKRAEQILKLLKPEQLLELKTQMNNVLGGSKKK